MPNTTLVREIDDAEVEVLGTSLRAVNVSVDGFPQFIAEHDYLYPQYFEVGGRVAWYTIAVWTDHAEIELLDTNTHEVYAVLQFTDTYSLIIFFEDLLHDYDPNWVEW